jgi:hypothetical protein
MKEMGLEAADLLEVRDKEIKPFVVEDTFNNNELSGFMCLRSDHRYGAMVITRVNDEHCKQIVYGTPKLHYPFDRIGNFRWPKQVSQVEAWEKLDGTNVLAYHYSYEGKDFISFKTRLTPVVKNSGSFGLFLDMWTECLDKNPWIYDLVDVNPEYNLSFEMFGSRNPITVDYKIPLDVGFLFGVRRTDYVVKPPSQLKITEDTKLPKTFEITANNLTEGYNFLRSKATDENTSGIELEGMVLYAFCNEPSWKQFKCKAEQVEQIHWSSGTIPKVAAWTTAINTFESEENPTFEDYKELLKEEYTVQQIDKSFPRLRKAWKVAKEHMEIVGEVNRAWTMAKEKGFDITEDKNGTMRFISQYFDKARMRKVGSIILKQAGLI